MDSQFEFGKKLFKKAIKYLEMSKQNGSEKSSQFIMKHIKEIGFEEEEINDCKNSSQITIPSSVTTIKDYCFNQYDSLVKIKIPSSVSSIGNYAFSECSKLSKIKIPSSVTSIGKYCFNNCISLLKIEIPSSVTSIGDYAFYISLLKIEIPSSRKKFQFLLL